MKKWANHKSVGRPPAHGTHNLCLLLLAGICWAMYTFGREQNQGRNKHLAEDVTNLEGDFYYHTSSKVSQQKKSWMNFCELRTQATFVTRFSFSCSSGVFTLLFETAGGRRGPRIIRRDVIPVGASHMTTTEVNKPYTRWRHRSPAPHFRMGCARLQFLVFPRSAVSSFGCEGLQSDHLNETPCHFKGRLQDHFRLFFQPSREQSEARAVPKCGEVYQCQKLMWCSSWPTEAW